MDELTLLRSIREDEPRPDEQALNRGMTALIAHIEGTPPRRAPRRIRRMQWIGAGSLVAGGVATVLVIGSIAGFPGWRGGADPAAAAVLDTAAIATIKTSDPVVRPGQYLEVSTRAVYSATDDDESGKPTTYLASQNGQVYVPADPNDTWVWVRDPGLPVQTFGAASERAANRDAAEHPKGEYLRAKSGAFYGEPADPSPADLRALPRDPSRLLQHVYAISKGDGDSAEGGALAWIADTLRTGIVPADLRAALYKAVAEIPGVQVIERQANLDGRTGIAIGRTETVGTRQELIIDPRTGLLIGERQVVFAAAAASVGLRNGTSVGWTAITTTVVDSVPGPAAAK